MCELLVLKRQQPRPNRRIIKGDVAESAAMGVGHPKILLQKLCALGATADRQEVDQLNEQLGAPRTGFANCRREPLQARNESIMSDPQERTARHIANSSGLHHDRARTPRGEAAIPFHHIVGHKAVFGRAPGDHGGHPGALIKRQIADAQRRKKARPSGLFDRGNMALGR